MMVFPSLEFLFLITHKLSDEISPVRKVSAIFLYLCNE